MAQNRPYTIAEVQQALNLCEFDGWSAQRKMTPAARESQRQPDKPGSPRQGGVLVVLYAHHGELQLVLTRRRDDLNSHAGQMSIPGGQRAGQETLVMTALRETEEEIGVPAHSLHVIGQLTPLYIPPSDFEVHPFVARTSNGSQPHFTPNPSEVAEIVEVPLQRLLDPASRDEQLWAIREHNISVPYYTVGHHKVWGATAMMISELVERLYAVRSPALSNR